MTKKCPSCEQEKPFSEFHKHKKLKFGLACNCKECVKKRSARFYVENRDKVLEQNTIWQKANPDKANSRRYRWVKKHPEKAAEADRRHYFKTYDAHESARLKRVYGISLEDKQRMFDEQEGKCEICGDSLQGVRKCHVDHNHITQKVRGLLCPHCNKGLSGFRDNGQFMGRAILYLKKYDS